MLQRLQQIGLKLEGTEGTAETPAAADADLLVYDVDFQPEIERNERTPSRRYLDPLPSVPGKQTGRVSFSVELKGSGSVATAPSWGKALKACKMQEAVVSTIAIGAVAGGPFRPGEVITGGTSEGTGLVVDRIADGTTTIPYVVLSGVLESGEELTGSVSGATADTSGAPTAAQGFNWRPVSTGDQSCTISFWHDGLLHKLFGARGTVKGSCKNGGIAMLRFEFTGVYDATTDVAMPDPTHEATVPISFLDVQAYLDTIQPIFATLDFDLGNALTPRESANAAKGILSVRVTGRKPTVTLDPETLLVAEFDFFGKYQAATTSYLRAQIDSVAGKKIVLAWGALSHDGLAKQNRGDIQTLGLTLGAVSPSVSTGDNTVLISML